MKPALNTVRRSLSAALLLAAAGVGAGCTDAGSEEPVVDPADETAPVVATTVPAARARGVREDQEIQISFDEPMDRASVEAAYASTDLPADQVTFAWNADGTVVTITPVALLAYAEGAGTDPTVVTPRTYAISIGVGATDLAGNPLAAPMELSFSTRRRLIALFGLDLNLTRVTLGNTSSSITDILVGDSTNKTTYRSYLTYDIASLPLGAEIEQAQFQGDQLTPDGAPYSMGGVNVHHVTFASNLGADMNAAPALSQSGTMSSDATLEAKKIDVTAQLSDDVLHRTARGDRSQYRLQIDLATNGDAFNDRARFAKNTFVLGAIYVVD